MPDEHEIVGFRVQAFSPGRRIIVGSEAVGLLGIDADQSSPDLGRLAGPGLARVDHPSWPHAELLDRMTCHPGNVVDALVDERSLLVLALGLGLPMLNQVELHGHHGRARTTRPSREAEHNRDASPIIGVVTRDDVLAKCAGFPGAVEDYPFGDGVAVFKVGGRMFVLVSLDGEPGSLNLKCDPELALVLRAQYPAVRPGYHQDKRHWNTVELDGSLGGELLEMIDHSYQRVVSRLPRVERTRLDWA